MALTGAEALPKATSTLDHAVELPEFAPQQRHAFAAAWAVFWMLMITVAVQDYARDHSSGYWRPVLWEGSSAAMATLILWWQARHLARFDARLVTPWRWALAPLTRLPLLALVFIGGIYALRHAVYANLGLTYEHEPWPQVLLRESTRFSIFYLLFVAVVFGVRSHAALHAQQRRLAQQRLLAQQAQLTQLAQQLEPHFLFNALNTIASAIHVDPDLADSLLTRLAELLRAASDLARRGVVSLDEELRLLDHYAQIMARRFVGRLELKFDIDAACGHCPVPALLLQPLLENAFTHGVEKHPGPVTVALRVTRQDAGGRVRVSVEQSVGRLDAAAARQGVGLTNLRQRLALTWGEAATLAVTARDGGGVVATLEFPCEC